MADIRTDFTRDEQIQIWENAQQMAAASGKTPQSELYDYATSQGYSHSDIDKSMNEFLVPGQTQQYVDTIQSQTNAAFGAGPTAKTNTAKTNTAETNTDDSAVLTKDDPFQQTTNERLATLTGQYGLLNTKYGTLNTSYLDLQKQLAALKTKSTAGTSNVALTTTNGVVNAGASNTAGLGAGAGAGAASGAVYGPDGTTYPNSGAAIAAGVYNYTMFPPSSSGSGQSGGLVENMMNPTSANKLSGVTGNYYGGVNQNPDNPWVNLYPPATK